jgi:predicted small lipoprotein YifL
VSAARARWIGICLALLALAACGIKGAPEPPGPEPAEDERGGFA